ncbi:septation protein SepH [Leucobacter soli]|uniref:septation protein SepH n=1 Tax=Leucobacter soli TaxID=2812850 RepID=UPI0036218043
MRAGKTREEVAIATGLDESDVERYEEPVLAERRYILELAQAVPVRTSPGDEEEQQFGAVIAERLIGLGARDPEWNSWRDDEAGWMISLEFATGDSGHRAVWSFDHRKSALSPLTPDADSLSKQGAVGDRLIPKLRAVDAEERFDSGAFDPERLTADFPTDPGDSGEPVNVSGPVAPDHPSTGSIPIVDIEAEYARRQHIEERAIKTPEPELPDLGQTADLLDALRRRRGERNAAEHAAGDGARGTSRDADAGDDAESGADRPQAGAKDPVRLPGTAPVTPIIIPPTDEEREQAEAEAASETSGTVLEPLDGLSADLAEPESGGDVTKQPLGPTPERGRRGKGRASIPSWDDILFGTRSDEDPA